MSPHTRRRFLAAAATAGVSLASCLDAEAPSGELERIGGSWPMIGHDGGHTRRVDGGPARPGMT
ncbi:MAG: twin-arginine translocation signal domain-containing protein [Halobacteriales archaeon]